MSHEQATRGERAPTPEQRAAITATANSLFVEAGAGTGKTGVMVDRYCRLVCEQGVSPDSVLAFTFTDKAAAELRQRIRSALQARDDTGSERARELLGSMGRAWITTIHGFCNRVLGGHPVAAGIDPRVRVLDGPETARAAGEAFDEALEEFLDTGEEARERTVAAFDIAGLRSIVIGTHAELRSRGMAEPRLPDPPQPDVAGAVRQAAEVAAATLEELRPSSPHRDLLQRAVEALGSARAPSVDELEALWVKSDAKGMDAYCKAIDAALARTAEAGEGGEAYRHIGALLELFCARFGAVKERRAGLDFEDLQILATQLLERDEIGDSYRARFTHVMVDEFQDTNRLQLRLIEALRGPRTELMVVGDELQSIYGFRHADLDVFREQRRAVEADAGAKAIALSGNFRAHPEIVGAVNVIGGTLLESAYRPLRVGRLPERTAPEGEGPAVELLLTGRDGWDEEGVDLAPLTDSSTPSSQLAEARFVAARLHELASQGVKRSAMVVLLRAFTQLDAYEDSLERAGLRPYVVGGRGYWSQQQVADVCALLATIANPLDDQALFGALASPACGVAPDTLWLLRAAAGRGNHVWPALERAGGLAQPELEDPSRIAQIPDAETTLLRGFAQTIDGLRRRAARLPLSDLIDAAVTETGYDLAVLMRPSGEARFANVRKLMRLAAEFEAHEGRDLRGLLDFLASRANADAEAQAATAVEGHDGVRIMTVHSAKGLEFDVVAVPQLGRPLIGGSWAPLLTIGHEPDAPRVGLRLRRLGASKIDLYSYAKLFEDSQRREAEEELRLFHVAATRARERLILSSVVKAKPGKEKHGKPVVERIAEAFELDREHDSSIAVPAPAPRPGLDAAFAPSEIAVRVSLASPERAVELRHAGREADAAPDVGEGAAPLIRRRPLTVPNRPLSYTALSAYEECAYRFYLERVLGLADESAPLPRGDGAGRDAGAARGALVHGLLEWSQRHGWQEPAAELVERLALAEGLDPGDTGLLEEVHGMVGSWLGCELMAELGGAEGITARAEVPVLLGIDDSILRGSIDLLVEREGAPPLVIDYKTDRLDGASPAVRSARYATQRAIYALGVNEARKAPRVDVAYVFLERPDEPDRHSYGPGELEVERSRLRDAIERIGKRAFEPAPREARSWPLCNGCPALNRMCSGPQPAR